MTQNFITRPHRQTLAGVLVLLLVSLCISLLIGCSAARLGYSHGESLSYWWLNRYIGFEDEQKAKVRADLAHLFAWHRSTQLKTYVQNLKIAQQRVHGPVSEATLRTEHAALRQHLLALAEYAMPHLADLALALQPQQIANIQEKFAANNDDYRKEHLRGDLEDRQRSRYKKTLKQAEYWFGSFSKEQEKLIRQASDARPMADESSLAGRIQRQAAIIALLKKIQHEKPDRDTTILLLQGCLASAANQFSDPRQQLFSEQTRDGSLQLWNVIFNMATQVQKQHFSQIAQQWIDDFSALDQQ